MRRPWIILLAFAALAACRTDEATAPEPVEMTAEAVGFYCQMNLLEHPGPKAQVHLKDVLQPLFFSQVRDGIAYDRMPEQSHEITATYVSDMGAAPGWDTPGTKNWIAAADAFYVVGSGRRGGMGAPELVPFGEKADAEAFAAGNGGRVMRLADIPDAEVLAAAGPGLSQPEGGPAADDGDYTARLRALANPETPP